MFAISIAQRARLQFNDARLATIDYTERSDDELEALAHGREAEAYYGWQPGLWRNATMPPLSTGSRPRPWPSSPTPAITPTRRLIGLRDRPLPGARSPTFAPGRTGPERSALTAWVETPRPNGCATASVRR